MEAAGRGGAGKRAVRQRDPTWALRCPVFPSLKYYSVRRERESLRCARRAFAAVFHATSNALSPPPRHGSRASVCVLPRGWTHGRGRRFSSVVPFLSFFPFVLFTAFFYSHISLCRPRAARHTLRRQGLSTSCSRSQRMPRKR